MKFILLLFGLISIVNSLEYKKNKHIKLSRKTENEDNRKVVEVHTLEVINNKINSRNSNFLILFHANWCIHCQEYLETIDSAITYEISKNFDFLKLNCTNYRDICKELGVNRFPTLNVFLKGEKAMVIPSGRDLESLLEYVDKINSPSITIIKSFKEIAKFSSNYGDVSFLLIDNINTNLFKCFHSLADDSDYKPSFYFFFIEKSKYRNENEIKLPAVVVS